MNSLNYDTLRLIYSYDDTYKIFFSTKILYELKYKINNIKVFINEDNNNLLILLKNRFFIHCDNLEAPTFVSTCIFNNKFPILIKKENFIKNYPQYKLHKLVNQKSVIDFIENKYSITFHPFIELFSFYED